MKSTRARSAPQGAAHTTPPTLPPLLALPGELRPGHALWPRPLLGVQAGHRAAREVLYYEGQSPAERLTLAVIGTRECSPEMSRITGSVIKLLALSHPEASVLSGLALGCDAAAHRAALAAGLHTTAVLPAGLDRVTPAGNRALAREVAAAGCLCAPLPAGSEITKSSFVLRDFLQAGMSDALLLVATGLTGGSWHATRETAALGRPLAWLDAPQGGGEKWDGNRALSAAHAAALAGNPAPLAALLRCKDEALVSRCTPITGQHSWAAWTARLGSTATILAQTRPQEVPPSSR